MMDAHTFSKRIYTWPVFVGAVRDILDHLGDLRAVSRERRVGRAFAEKIMLAVTRVNGCRYCSYAHSRAALAAGISPTELKDLLAGEYSGLPESESVAVVFAQHWAETNAYPDPAACERLLAYYGPQTARHILATIRMISLGNLYGNTFDALLSRLGGNPAPGSTIWNELAILLGAFILLPGGLLLRILSRLIHRPSSRQPLVQ